MIFKKIKSLLMVNATHFKALCKRYVSLIASDKFALITLIFQAPIMVLVIKLACETEFTYWKANTTMFVVACIAVVMATLNSYREICKERDILIRETNAGLDSSAYVLSKVVVQGVICLFQALILVIGTSLIIDFNIHSFTAYFNYFFVTFLVLLSSTCVGLLISAVLKNSDSAILPVLFIIIAQIVLSGAIIDLPKGVEFLSVVAISRWGLGAYSHIFNFRGLADNLKPGMPIKPIFNASYLFDNMVMILICLICIVLTIVAVSRLRKKKF